MALLALDACLIFSTVTIVTLDIALALCLRFILPYHVTQRGWYPTNGKKYEFDDAAEVCSCLRAVFPAKTKSRITFAKVENKRSLGEDFFHTINQYPYLVSLSIPAYVDDPDTKIFACNGLALTSDTLLTIESCVLEENEWYNLTVRSESSFWSQGGNTHSVVDVLPGKYKGFVELKIWPQFSEAVISGNSIKYPSNGNWTYGISLGWNDHMYQQNMSSRFKYKVFDIEEWTSERSITNSSRICYDLDRCKFSSKPLLTSCHQLVGMEVNKEHECEGFLGMSNFETYEQKLFHTKCRPVYKDDGTVKEKEICQI